MHIKAKVKIPVFLLTLLNLKLLLPYLDMPHQVRVMWCNVTFNNISVISCKSALLEETRIPGENHRPVTSPWQTSSHNVVSSTPRHLANNLSGDGHQLHTYSKSNYQSSRNCQSCQIWPAKFEQILIRTDTRLVFYNRKLMTTDIILTMTTEAHMQFCELWTTILSWPLKSHHCPV